MFEQTPANQIEQISAMRMGTEYRGNISVRGFALTVRPLSIGESVAIAAKVVEEVQKLPVNFRNQLTEHFILARETLVLASTSDVGSNDPKLTNMIVERMTNDEVHSLFKQYTALCDRVNPALETLSEEDVKGLVEQLKKNKEEPDLVYQLTELSISQLSSMVLHFLKADG